MGGFSSSESVKAWLDSRPARMETAAELSSRESGNGRVLVQRERKRLCSRPARVGENGGLSSSGSAEWMLSYLFR